MASNTKVGRYLALSVPFIRLAGDELSNLDDNDTGTDDKIGAAITYAADIIDAVRKNRAIPLPPTALFSLEDLQANLNPNQA